VFSWFLLSVDPGVPPAAGLSGEEAVVLSARSVAPEKATKAETAMMAEVLRRFFISASLHPPCQSSDARRNVLIANPFD
jgi:hypothetical protein